MKKVGLYSLFNKRVLVTRQSARDIAPDIDDALATGEGAIVLDFSNVEGMTPSFMDETICVIEERSEARNAAGFSIVMEKPPTRLSSKYAAIGRAHGLEMREDATGAWTITKSGA